MNLEQISLNNYNKEMQQTGDVISNILKNHALKTWDHDGVNIYQEGNSFITTTSIPKGYFGVVHSATGFDNQKDYLDYSRSLIGNLITDSKEIKGKPWAFACCIDASSSVQTVADKIGKEFSDAAIKLGFAYLNGEYAILPHRVSDDCKVNISGMMLSIVPNKNKNIVYKIIESINADKNHKYQRFFDIIESLGPLFMNSDGTGTKGEFSERMNLVGSIVQDSAVMKTDDAARVGSTILALHDYFEYNNLLNGMSQNYKKRNKLFRDAIDLSNSISREGGFIHRLFLKDTGDRISGYKEGVMAQNCSGNVIGKLNLDLYRQLNSYDERHQLIAIVGPTPNPRSNGISARRAFMVKHFGEDYHNNPKLKPWLDYLSAPSTMMYPVVMDLASEGLCSLFTHNSGGALENKLLHNLAKKGLGVNLTNLPKPYPIDIKMIDMDMGDVREAYRTFPMGVDGFIATNKPFDSINMLKKWNLEGYVVGMLEKMDHPTVSLKAYDGTPIEYQLKK